MYSPFKRIKKQFSYLKEKEKPLPLDPIPRSLGPYRPRHVYLALRASLLLALANFPLPDSVQPPKKILRTVLCSIQ